VPRPCRQTPGGVVYHVLNRSNGRRTIFNSAGDYLAFQEVLAEVQQETGMRILAWCLMPNHWHLVLWPEQDGALSDFARLVTLRHVRRWHAYRGTTGMGHVYQGRFKSFLVQNDAHFLTVCRYVEANALRAGLVDRAEKWPWGSLRQLHGQKSEAPAIASWPLPRPSDWTSTVNEAMTPSALNHIRRCAARGAPYGDDAWVHARAQQLGLESTLRARGRPKQAGDVQKKGS